MDREVALFAVERWASAAEWPDDTSRVLMRLDTDGRYWSAVEGDPAAPFIVHVDSPYLHRLVVIDPEDREQVKRLLVAILAQRDPLHPDASGIADALREFADPKPPKPDEPTGLGAVVVDSNDALWVRATTNTENDCAWIRGERYKSRGEAWVYESYDLCVDAVKVLSVGLPELAEPLADWERDLLRGQS